MTGTVWSGRGANQMKEASMQPAGFEASSHARENLTHVVIAGGGVAALEAVLALRQLAGERVAITLITADHEFVYRPMVVREPFSGPLARRYQLDEIAADLDLDLRIDRVDSVNADERKVQLHAGGSVGYDALLIAVGALEKPSFPHALNINDRLIDDELHGLLQDIEDGLTKSVAFLVPPEETWRLPLYELALMTAARAYEMDVKIEVTIVTPEHGPLAVFGTAASRAVQEALDRLHVVTLTQSTPRVSDDARLFVDPEGRELRVDRLVALPQLFGPGLAGLPADARGFIPVDKHGRVRDVSAVFAAGDATDFPIKQGGISAQEAVAAAETIAALAGIEIDPRPFRPVMHALMLGPKPPLYLRSQLVDGVPTASEASTEPLWFPPSKIDSQYLSPYLIELDYRER
jgi:sulfide:quinone oxidoreductase